jgi:hypothetical protein
MVTILNASTLNWAEGANESNDVSQSAVNSKSRFNTLLQRRRNYVGNHHHHPHHHQQTTSSTLLSRGFLALFRKYQQYSFVTVDESAPAPAATDADISTLTVCFPLGFI